MPANPLPIPDQLTALQVALSDLMARVDALEQAIAAHQAGAARRQAEVDQVRADHYRTHRALRFKRR